MGWQDAPLADEGKKAAWESAPLADEAKPDPIKTAINKSGTAGLVDAGLALGSGAIAAPVSGLAGIAGTLLPGKPGQGARWTENVQDAMSYEPKTEIGQGITKAVSYPFQKLAEGADIAGSATAEGTKSPLLGAGVNTALQSVPMVLGRVGAGAKAVEASTARAAALKLKNAQTDAAMIAAKKAGLSLPPSQVNPSLLNKTVEGFGGKIKTAQDLSVGNQPLLVNITKKGLGLPEEAPLSIESVGALRKDAGKAYERVRDSGAVTTDPVYAQSLDKIAIPFEKLAKDFPDAARTDILDAVKAHRRDTFDAGSAVDQISGLREQADAAYAARDKKAGKAYKSIAGALEEQLGRHLEATGAPANVLADFQNARQTIAKTYTVQKYLGANGEIDAVGLSKELKKGKISGDLKTVAEFGKNFPKAAQLPSKIGGVPMSPLDHGVAGAAALGGIATGHPLVALGGLVPYARPMARKLMASEAYQNKFVNPQVFGPSVMSRLQQLQSSPTLQMLEMAEGQQK